MKRFNPNKVKPLGNLQPSPEKDRAHAKRVYKKACEAKNYTPERRLDDADKRSFLPRKESYKPPRLRGASGTRLSAPKRAMVERRSDDRKAFFASIGVVV